MHEATFVVDEVGRVRGNRGKQRVSFTRSVVAEHHADRPVASVSVADRGRVDGRFGLGNGGEGGEDKQEDDGKGREPP